MSEWTYCQNTGQPSITDLSGILRTPIIGSSGDELSDHEDPQMFALSQAAGRLRGIIALVNSGYLTMEILLNNLEAAARKSFNGNLEF